MEVDKVEQREAHWMGTRGKAKTSIPQGIHRIQTDLRDLMTKVNFQVQCPSYKWMNKHMHRYTWGVDTLCVYLLSLHATLGVHIATHHSAATAYPPWGEYCYELSDKPLCGLYSWGMWTVPVWAPPLPQPWPVQWALPPATRPHQSPCGPATWRATSSSGTWSATSPSWPETSSSWRPNPVVLQAPSPVADRHGVHGFIFIMRNSTALAWKSCGQSGF